MANVPPLPNNAAQIAAMLTTADTLDENITSLVSSIHSLPDKFTELTRPIQINGIPLALPENGQLTLQTAAGNITLQILSINTTTQKELADLLTPLLQNQKPVSLVVQPGNPPTVASLNIPNLPTPRPIQPTDIFPTSFTTLIKTAFLIGQEIKATILPQEIVKAFTTDKTQQNPVNLKTQTSANAFSVPDFLSNALKMNSIGDALKSASVSAWTETVKNFLSATDTHISANVAVGNNGQQAPTLASTQMKPGTEWRVRVDFVMENGKPLPPLRQDQIAATVIGKGPDNQLLLNTDKSAIFIRQGGEIPIGGKVIMTLLPHQEQDFSLQPPSQDKATALQQLMSALAQVEPNLAAQILQKSIPQPNAALPSTLLFLLNVLQQNNVREWLGGNVAEKLEKSGKLDLITKLVEEFQQASGAARDPTVGQWRAWPLPLFNGQSYEMLHLYVRRERDRKQADANYPVSPQTRFLVTMNMTQLGPMQMDGLSQKKQLDLIVRSERAMPPHLPNELRATYLKTIEALGLTGSINFQTGRQHWISAQIEKQSAGLTT